MDCFWQSIAVYNSQLLWAQPVWFILAAAAAWLLAKRDSPVSRLAVRLFMAATCAWIAVVYFGIYAECRAYNEIEVAIWLLMAFIWTFDAFDPCSCSERPKRRNLFAIVPLAAPVLYPILSLIFGHRWPDMTTPLMPCSVAVYMIGLILAFRARVNLVIVLIICHWMLLGITKAKVFSIPEDYLLVATTLPALWYFMCAYIRRQADSGHPLKPSPRVMMGVLAVIFLLIIALCVINVLS